MLVFAIFLFLVQVKLPAFKLSWKSHLFQSFYVLYPIGKHYIIEYLFEYGLYVFALI